MRSLERTLLGWLLPPLIIVGAVAAGGATVFMEHRLDAAYDQDLGDIARALVPYLRLDGSKVSLAFNEQADAVLRADSTDQIYYAVKDGAGALVAGDAALPSAPVFNDDVPVFWDDTRLGEPVRAVAMLTYVDGQSAMIIAAETRAKRNAAARDAMVSALTP